MRKFGILSPIVLCAVLVLGLAASAARDVSIKVYVNGALKKLTPTAIMRNNTAYLPLNAAAAVTNAKVTYNKSAKTYTVTAFNNSKKTIRESQGIKVNGQFMVPANIGASAFDYNWNLNKSNKSVSLTSKPAPRPAPPPSSG